ncbi:hypothetical protein D3C78_1030010 [compost metagenome]
MSATRGSWYPSADTRPAYCSPANFRQAVMPPSNLAERCLGAKICMGSVLRNRMIINGTRHTLSGLSGHSEAPRIPAAQGLQHLTPAQKCAKSCAAIMAGILPKLRKHRTHSLRHYLRSTDDPYQPIGRALSGAGRNTYRSRRIRRYGCALFGRIRSAGKRTRQERRPA